MVTKLETILKEAILKETTLKETIQMRVYKLNQMRVDKKEPNDLDQVGICRTTTTIQLTEDFKTQHEDFKEEFYHILKENPKLDIYEYARKRILLRILESITDVFGVTRKVYSDNPTSDYESNLIIYVTPDSNVGTMMLRLFTYDDKVDIELWDINGTPNILTIL